MNDLDFERIENLFLKLSGDFDNKLNQQSEVFEKNLNQQSEVFEKNLNQKTEELRRGFGAEFEDFQHKLELVVEGQQMLGERMDRMGVELKQEISKVDQRVTAVAADLSAHRKDTEAYVSI